MVRKCAYCRTVAEPTDKYCIECGDEEFKEVEEKPTTPVNTLCRHCGQDLGARFSRAKICPACGWQAHNGAPAASLRRAKEAFEQEEARFREQLKRTRREHPRWSPDFHRPVGIAADK